MNPRPLSLLIVLVSLSCATPGSRPHEMGIAQDEAAADQEDLAASGKGAHSAGLPDVSWTSVTDPANADPPAAAEHRRHAADHRAGSAALREAEARACAGVSPEGRELSPFVHTEDIQGVTPLKGPDAPARGKHPPRSWSERLSLSAR